jgi:hypothetical protein
MGAFKQPILVILIAALWLCSSPDVAGPHAEGITENECARLLDAEIVWDLNKFSWMCCEIKNENEYETCFPITDMKPLPKTSIKPFPPSTPQTIKP